MKIIRTVNLGSNLARAFEKRAQLPIYNGKLFYG